MNLRLGFGLALVLTLALLPLGCGSRRAAQSVQPAAAPKAPVSNEPQSSTKTTGSDERLNLDSGEGWGIITPTQGVDFGPYIRQLLQVIKARWYSGMPQAAMAGAKGRVSVVVRIERDGTVPGQYPQIGTGSGVEVLDKAALDAIRKSEPFSALPEQFNGPYLDLRILFVYNMPVNISATRETPK